VVAAQLMGKPFGTRGNVIDIPSLMVMKRIALLERPLCWLRRADTRCAGVVRRLIVLIARYAGCGTKARYAVRPLWATESCAERGTDEGPSCRV